MNKKFIISVIVVFILATIFGMLVHGMLLGPSYKALGSLMRPEAEVYDYLAYGLIAHLVLAFSFVWIYNKGKEDKPFISQGICYGLAIASITAIPMFLIYYAVQPLPGILVVKQIVGDTITYVIMGIVVAWINK